LETVILTISELEKGCLRAPVWDLYPWVVGWVGRAHQSRCPPPQRRRSVRCSARAEKNPCVRDNRLRALRYERKQVTNPSTAPPPYTGPCRGVCSSGVGTPLTSPYSGLDCVKSLRSSYTGFYPQKVPRMKIMSLKMFLHRDRCVYRGFWLIRSTPPPRITIGPWA